MALIACSKSWSDYLRQLKQLLPPGYAWDWSPSSVGMHLLAACADELARAHAFLCNLANEGILRFEPVAGWSAPEYEALLLNQFGIHAQVSDGLLPMHCEQHCEHALLDHTVVFIYVITVDDATAIPEGVKIYLSEYQQSHTHFWFRDRSLRVVPSELSELIVINATDCEAICTDPLYEQAWQVMRANMVVELACDWTWLDTELTQLPSWPEIAPMITSTTTVRRRYASH